MVVFVLWWCLLRLTFLSILAAGTEQCETWVTALQALRRVLRQLTSPGPDSSVEERRLQIKGTMTVSQNIWKYAEAELPIIPRSWLRSLTIVVKEEKKVPVRTLSDQSLSRISHMPSKKCVPALGHCFPWFRFKIYLDQYYHRRDKFKWTIYWILFLNQPSSGWKIDLLYWHIYALGILPSHSIRDSCWK